MLNRALIDRYRCPESLAEYCLSAELSRDLGYFRFGHGAICYGQSTAGFRSKNPTYHMYDACEDVEVDGTTIRLPFDPISVIDNLRLERYVSNGGRNGSSGHIGEKVLRSIYYSLRPFMPIGLRKHFQRIYLNGWDKKPFPRWPVERSVEEILEKLLAMSMKAQALKEVPFIWFWPEGASSCLLMTHDVETASGRNFCPHLMDIDDAYDMKASFQIVPERQYLVSENFLDMIRERRFEIGIHDFNHDGHLFSDRDEFLRRAKLINQYARKYGARGFRSAVLYRNLDWYDELDFSYDMSVPNVAHLDPQQGGCCTVMPYYIGKLLEIPVTTIQDYSLFYILGKYSIELWKRQIDLIQQMHGVVSFIIHPDYVREPRIQGVYCQLLEYLSRMCSRQNVWKARPREVDEWWRQRSRMKLVERDKNWLIEGQGHERARVAYAILEHDRLTYRIAQDP